MAPAAINKEMPPSIGIQGGGQHVGSTGGGGGGAPARHTDEMLATKINNRINLVFILQNIECKDIKINCNGNSYRKIMPNYYICNDLKRFCGTKKE